MKGKKASFSEVDPHPNFPKIEEEILKFWEKEKIFEKSLKKTIRGKSYTFYDGPPFATGLPHYGHILASTIKDVIPRYQTMRGRYVRRRWGWDCHGLPIEEIVERKLGISGKKDIERIGIKKFNETCRAMVLQYVDEWGKMVRRIARWVDFDNAYKTMDREYMESVWWAFKEIYDKNLIYEGRKVLLYCPRCETPISNFEVAMDNSYKEVTEEAIVVKFKVVSSKHVGGKVELTTNNLPTYFLAWTTTPWTLPGNVALAVGESIRYQVVSIKGENFIVAADLADRVLNTEYQILNTVAGKNLIGLEYEPLYEIAEVKANPKSYHVYEADFVNTEEGTGIVHTAVVYGEDDYALGLKKGLPILPLLDEKGVFNEKSPNLMRGQYFKDSEKVVKKDLDARGLIFERKMHQHSYPHCWRCGTTLFYNAIPAWFIGISKIKNQILKSNEKEINWYPEHLKFGRYAKSVESAPDWNISRNRYWGNPIPVWKCEKCKKNTVIGSITELKKRAVSGFSENLDLHRPYIDEVVVRCAHCGGKSRRIPEIFDSWVEAASMPFAELHYPFENEKLFKSRFPAQFVAEYIAQTRAWFYVTHVFSQILFSQSPFENVVTTGTILNEKGEKLSKSRKNFPDPWEIINKHGVDTLRFYLMSSVVMQADNLFFNERDLENVNRKIIRILWNIYNYFVTYSNEAHWRFDPKVSPEKTKKSKNILDRWANARLQKMIREVTQYMDDYDTVRATRGLESYLNDLSTWYLRRSRGRSDHEFFATLYRALIYVSKALAPFTPFISEHIYRNLNHPDFSESVHLTEWPKLKEERSQRSLLEQMQRLREIVEEAHALRAKAGIKLRQPVASLQFPISNFKFSNEMLEILKEEINAKQVIEGSELKLDTNLTEDLKVEGLARELERQINQFRKESGLKIGEMINLLYETKSANMEKAFKLMDKKKVYINEIKTGVSGKSEAKLIIANGEEVKLLITN